MKELVGPELVRGSATGHSHSLVGTHKIYDAGNGTKIVVALGSRIS